MRVRHWPIRGIARRPMTSRTLEARSQPQEARPRRRARGAPAGLFCSGGQSEPERPNHTRSSGQSSHGAIQCRRGSRRRHSHWPVMRGAVIGGGVRASCQVYEQAAPFAFLCRGRSWVWSGIFCVRCRRCRWDAVDVHQRTGTGRGADADADGRHPWRRWGASSLITAVSRHRARASESGW